MAADVFLSYARAVSAEHARAVHEALVARGASVFLDVSDIEHGDHFTAVLIDALLAAKVVAVFADEAYFARWYCLWEWRIARTPFVTVAERPGATAADKEAALAGLVIALPPAGRPAALDRLPPFLREMNWPAAANADAVADVVQRQLARGLPSLGDRLDALPETGGTQAVRHQLLGVVRLPPPRHLRGIPRAPLVLPQSIGEHFVGRADDLWRIDDLLVTRAGGASGAAALTGALTAMGGVGKTRLALEYLHRLAPDHFRGGLFWIDAELDASLVEARHHEILQALDPSAPPIQVYRDPQSGRDLTRDLVRALEALPLERPALVVLDNLPEPDAGADEATAGEALPLEACWPAIGLTALLLTSRFDVSLAAGGTVAALPLGALTRNDAVALLTDLLPARGTLSNDEWSELAAWVGDLPLALTLLNAALRAGGLAPKDLLARARAAGSAAEAADAAMQALRGHVATGQARAALRGISEAMRISYERLTPDQQRAARVLAQLAPAPIPAAVLDALPEVFPPAVRVALTTHSFVTPLPGGAPPLFGVMHRVLADFLRGRTEAGDERGEEATDETTTARRAFGAVMSPEACGDPAAWPLMQACVPHVERLIAVGAADERADAEEVAWLAVRLTLYHSAQGSVARTRAAAELAVDIASRRLGPEHPLTLTGMNNLASALHDQGDLAGSRTLQERVVEIRTRVLGLEHPDTLGTINNLALTLNAQGDFAGARTLHECVLKAYTFLLGPDHPRTLVAMNNLATTLADLGDHAGARRLQEEAVEAHTRALGAEHPDTLAMTRNLAVSRAALGDLAGARALTERVLDIFTRLLGPEHPRTLRSTETLAVMLTEAGDLAGARALQEQVLETYTRVFGAEHPSALQSMANLATTLYEQGDLERARGLHERVLEARTRLLGAEHPDTRASRRYVGIVLRALGDSAASDALDGES